MTSLGKRKAGQDEVTTSHGSTIFVSNLPYSATSIDLQTLFSDLAPVRSAFVVTDTSSGVSKGVGYVSFSVREDAQMAYDQICKDGIDLNGRSLRIQWAENKPTERKERKPAAESKPARVSRPTGPKDPLAIRTVVLGGLPSSIDEKVLWKKVRKCTGAVELQYPVSGDVGAANVVFQTPANAADAVTKLHAHVYKGSLLSASLKKRLETLPTKKKTSATPSNASRLIVRNMPFDISEQDIRAIFLSYGPIYAITIPKDEDSQKAKGFAFVHFYSAKDAQKAMDGANGKNVHSGMAESLVEDKQKRKKDRRLAAKAAAAAVKEEDEPNETSVLLRKSRPIAVDWALSKDRWEEEKSKLDDGDVHMDGPSDKDDVSEDESEDEDSQLGIHLDSEGSDSDTESDGDQDLEKPELPPPETGTTIFIRNVPYSATEDDLRTLFRKFGPLRYARITLDFDTGRSRGTGFACFWNKEHADAVIQESERVKQDTLGLASDDTAAKEKERKKNPFAMHSILTPDPSAASVQNLVLHGRTLDVVRAVTRDEATKLREDGEKRREKADKRNIYLLREGVIFPNSPAAATVSATDLGKRQSSFSARKTLLKTNPSLYVSKKRLSIRQIPLFVSERNLKRLAIHAVKQFEAEVKTGQRNGLSADELSSINEETPSSDDDEESTIPKRRPPRTRGIKQAKIIRVQDRVDALTGKGRSKGYGFVEMNSHADALRVLRWANNHPDVHGLFRTWWIEELGDLVKLEKSRLQKAKKDSEDTQDGEARLKRSENELEVLKSGAGKKGNGQNLIVEFSIENIQVVRRRTGTEKGKRQDHKKSNKISEKVEVKEETAPTSRPFKKRKTGKDTAKELVKDSVANVDQPPKAGSKIGSIIGRKRKERKGGKKKP
ncbi:hypothetical protein DL96DRAFT_1792260 [Flagelloscypha sp. PMI_526]|nr:hypothetical protein DL96DRAFT_1792260 [Flagelloscypha sp. PMI_526]